jgi:dihydroxyacetone kinase-like predicted kinase
VAGSTIEEVVLALLKEMNQAQREIITLYYGETVGENEAHALADLLLQNWPDQEVEVVAGGQPHYHYILSVE